MEKKYHNSGALFARTVKKNPKAPDYSGEIEVDLDVLGIGNGSYKFAVAGWKKFSARGTAFLSLKISEFRERQGGDEPKQQEEDPF